MSIAPELHYRDVAAATAFLGRAFGFASRGGAASRTATRVELAVGRGTVVVGALDSSDGFAYRTPHELGGRSTGSPYVAVPDLDAAYARAVAARARIAREPGDTSYGSRDFGAYDPEGVLWWFGTYHPTANGAPPATDRDVFAGMRYRDARGMIDWLGRAFGFTEHFVVPDDGDGIAHAQLAFGDALLMLGSARDDGHGFVLPAELDGAYTQTLEVRVTDPATHHARAVAAGAEILVPHGVGGAGFVARDPEGYVWRFVRATTPG